MLSGSSLSGLLHLSNRGESSLWMLASHPRALEKRSGDTPQESELSPEWENLQKHPLKSTISYPTTCHMSIPEEHAGDSVWEAAREEASACLGPSAHDEQY